MNNNNTILKQLKNFSELLQTPLIISDSSDPAAIVHINRNGIKLINEIFNSVDEFMIQVTGFTGIFRNIVKFNKLETVYSHVIEKKKPLEDLFVSFTCNKNNLHSMLLKVSILSDENHEKSYICTSIYNISETYNYRAELNKSKKFLEGFIEAFARDRMVYLIAYEHEETVKHLMEVREFSKLIAHRIMTDSRMPEQNATEYTKITPLYIKILEVSALLHDFGKIHFDVNPIIQLPRKLSSEEFETVKKHTIFGAELIGSSNEMLRMCRLVARHHHEKWDGSGYPDGLKGRDIPLSARIVAFADMFSALRDRRAYKRAITDGNEIIDIFKQFEHHFDPVIFKTGIELVPEMLKRFPGIATRYRELQISSDSFIKFMRGIISS